MATISRNRGKSSSNWTKRITMKSHCSPSRLVPPLKNNGSKGLEQRGNRSTAITRCSVSDVPLITRTRTALSDRDHRIPLARYNVRYKQQTRINVHLAEICDPTDEMVTHTRAWFPFFKEQIILFSRPIARFSKRQVIPIRIISRLAHAKSICLFPPVWKISFSVACEISRIFEILLRDISKILGYWI